MNENRSRTGQTHNRDIIQRKIADFKLTPFAFDLLQKFEAVPDGYNRSRTRKTRNRDIMNISLTSSSRSVL